jgi:hypothetical protein
MRSTEAPVDPKDDLDNQAPADTAKAQARMRKGLDFNRDMRVVLVD